jgi:hypothetical protein
LVINLGLVGGAGLYESRIVVPQWLVSLPSGGFEWRADVASEMNVGLRFWVFLSTGPLTLLTAANVWLAARQRAANVRLPWLSAALIVLAERALTFGYFIPTMLRLLDSDLPRAQAVALAEGWTNLNTLRHGLVSTSLLLAVYTFYRHTVHTTQASLGRAGHS